MIFLLFIFRTSQNILHETAQNENGKFKINEDVEQTVSQQCIGNVKNGHTIYHLVEIVINFFLSFGKV